MAIVSLSSTNFVMLDQVSGLGWCNTGVDRAVFRYVYSWRKPLWREKLQKVCGKSTQIAYRSYRTKHSPSDKRVENWHCRIASQYNGCILAASFQLGSAALQERDIIRYVPLT